MIIHGCVFDSLLTSFPFELHFSNAVISPITPLGRLILEPAYATMGMCGSAMVHEMGWRCGAPVTEQNDSVIF